MHATFSSHPIFLVYDQPNNTVVM